MAPSDGACGVWLTLLASPLIVALIGLTYERGAGAADPALPSASSADAKAAEVGVDAAPLISEIRRGEKWVDDVESFRMHVESTWLRTPDAIERRKAELKKQVPDIEPTVERWPELKPEQHDTLELAFDRKRLYCREDSTDSHRLIDLRVWDGTRAVVHEKHRNQEHYALDDEPYRNIGTYLMGHTTGSA